MLNTSDDTPHTGENGYKFTEIETGGAPIEQMLSISAQPLANAG
ncbi:MAG TPA: hypothetical protein VGO67_09855 [Verrucomicrobiae bacterium]